MSDLENIPDPSSTQSNSSSSARTTSGDEVFVDDGHWPFCSLSSRGSSRGSSQSTPSNRGGPQQPVLDDEEDTIANERRAVDNEAIGLAKLESVVSQFRDRKQAHGELVADDLLDLSAAYAVAEARAEADRATRVKRPYLKHADYFTWHLRSIAGEFALPSHESDTTLQWRAFEAHELVTRYPAWVAAIRAGRVRLQHARAFLRDTRALDAEHLPVLAEQALKFALTHTVSETHRFVEREVATLAAENFEAAHADALEERRVTITHEGLGMSTIHATVATEVAIGIDKQLTLDARTIQDANRLDASANAQVRRAAESAGNPLPSELAPDKRTVAQIRADVFAEMLLCGDPESLARAERSGASRVSASLSVVVPVLSLLDGRVDGSQPALVDGVIPIGFEQARKIAAEAPSWQRILTDPITGHTLCVDSYRPDVSMRRYLQVRDRTCCFPGCARPALGSDADHTQPYAEGGKTCECNICHLCRAHHVQKHQRRWKMRQLGGGVIEWITPLGQRVITEPEAIGPRFVATDYLSRGTPERPEDPPDIPPPF